MLHPRKQRTAPPKRIPGRPVKPAEAVGATVEAEVAVEVPEPPKTTRPNRKPRSKAADNA
jgi:hypothetical protein